MLNPGTRRASLAGRLLLSSALVAVSLAYGWWQRPNAAAPDMATAPMPKPPAANSLSSARASSTMTAHAGPAAPAAVAAPDVGVAASPRGASGQTTTPVTPGTATIAKTPAAAPAAPRAAQSQQDAGLPASPPAAPLTALAALRMYQPPPPQPPLPPVRGTPAPGAAAPIPAGTHLQDGDYLSDTQQYEWGDLQVKISVQGGQIIGAQVVQYPDHRSESLQLSQMASPILNSELIQTQQAKVDIVSSATDTSYAYRDAIASVIIKATRE